MQSIHWLSLSPLSLGLVPSQGVRTACGSVATGIKIGSNDQRDISDKSSDHSHFHERGSKKALIKARRDVVALARIVRVTYVE